ncbi:hypothetical protein CPB86DRAFT_735387 [Serendipita vermifera]|nr:hypothetical protein CPB86DRAFT_735387 [Serendipita vermifera]
MPSKATLLSLPAELKLDIFSIISEYSAAPPIMARDVAWAAPPPPKIYQQAIIQTDGDLADAVLDPDAESWNGRSLKSLRLVCGQFNTLCTPLLFRELSLPCHYNKLQEILEAVIPHFGRHVHAIKAEVNRDSGPGYLRNWKLISGIMAVIISRCTNLNTLAIRYRDGRVQLGDLVDVILNHLNRGNLTSLGIYSVDVLGSVKPKPRWASMNPMGPVGLLSAIVDSPKASKTLKRLDLVLESLTPESYDKIRSGFPNLQSLTVRRAFTYSLPRFWDHSESQKWTGFREITTLALVNCSNAHAAHMSHIVRHFKQLRELLWSKCGTSRDPLPPPLKRGWSEEPDALHKHRSPLKTMQLEHALEWEIMAMGVIPAETVIIANTDEDGVVEALSHGVELFIGMKTLRVSPPRASTTTSFLQSTDSTFRSSVITGYESYSGLKRTLEQISEEGKFALRRDAEICSPCNCCPST